jgi:hypothetical protein
MIRIGSIGDNRNELQRALDKTRDVVTDDILNAEGQKAQREIKKTQRASNKARAFNRKNKRRNKRRK